MDFDDQETKPYSFACPQCGASPTTAGRTQPGTALVATGELQEWLAVAEHVVDTLEAAGGRINLPADLVGAFDQMTESVGELASRLRQLRHELEG